MPGRGADAMAREIGERDWRVLRELCPVALDRFCGRVLSEVGRLAAGPESGGHRRYLEVFDLIRRRDRELADLFDDLRRSTALIRLLHMQSHGLLTEEEWARFSPETRELLRSIAAAGPG